MSAPASRAARATSARVVSIESRPAPWPRRPAQHRRYAPNLLGGLDPQRAGAGRLAAHVDDVGAEREQRQAVFHGAARVSVTAAVGKRVGRDVQDPHQPGAVAEPARFTAHPEGVAGSRGGESCRSSCPSKYPRSGVFAG